ncbi:ribonuclease inhibitor-like [Sinocyclocheilus rhinocerous]|uniref:ribonuclease inhibitor-like n=1 Tax=Sinocyclocheilus rhinocerous TaxID=307959 RepID=UPI0007B85E19|nr:PREDICTED: ribonuclease inhibitor-like [Sinocyclocheilus rhinocerous]
MTHKHPEMKMFLQDADFFLDWAEGKENRDVQLIFPLPFRELNLMKNKTLSLSNLLQYTLSDLINSPEKSINLFHCLNELGDHSLVEEIQQYLRSGSINKAKLSSSQWSAVAFVLLASEKMPDEFDINKFVEGNNETKKLEVFQKLLPVIKESRSVQSNPSHLRQLTLSNNNLGSSGVHFLSTVLKDPQCKLKNLCLWECGITDEGCAALASALRSNPEHLRHLDLSNNNLKDTGVKLLSAGLKTLHSLEKLWLWRCRFTVEGFTALASTLKSNPEHLKDLNLSANKVGNSLTLLSEVLRDPRCKLERLQLYCCSLTVEGCAALASALRSNPSHLRQLDLSDSKIGDSVVNQLSAVLEDPRCKLEKLWLRGFGVTGEGCAALTSALRSNPEHLRNLNLSNNNLGQSGRKLLSDLRADPHYKLQKLQI